MSSLELRQASLRYGHGTHLTTALNRVNLTVPTNSIIGLVGESGSGKSTVARAFTGLLDLDEGAVCLNERPLPALRKRTKAQRKQIQMVFQDPYASLNPRMAVGSAIAEALPDMVSRATAHARVEELLSMVGLDPQLASRLPASMSGGQRQRVAIARALAPEPAYLIADEITSALDVSVQGAILNLIKDLQRQLGLGLLFISHDLAVVRYVSDAVHVMFRGKIVEQGPADALMTRPVHPYTQALVESVPGLKTVDATPPELELLSPETAAPATGCPYRDRCAVGPLVRSERSVCEDTDPQRGAKARIHAAACHFVPLASTSPVRNVRRDLV